MESVTSYAVVSGLSPPQRLLGIIGNREDWGEGNIKRAGLEREEASAEERGVRPMNETRNIQGQRKRHHNLPTDINSIWMSVSQSRLCQIHLSN